MDVITYPCWDQSWPILVKGAPGDVIDIVLNASGKSDLALYEEGFQLPVLSHCLDISENVAIPSFFLK